MRKRWNKSEVLMPSQALEGYKDGAEDVDSRTVESSRADRSRSRDEMRRRSRGDIHLGPGQEFIVLTRLLRSS